MGLPILRQNDPWGQIGSSLGNALMQGSQFAMKEQGDARAEQRKMTNERANQEYQESRLKKALQDVYANPEFQQGDLQTKQRILTEHVAPIDKQIAKQIGDFNIDAHKAMNPAPQKGPAPSNVPVPPEQAAKISEILEKNKGANAFTLKQKFDESGIPPVYSNSYVESQRRDDETKAKNDQKNETATRQEKIAFHKESAKYDEDLLHKTEVAKKQLDTIQDIEKRLASGKVKPNSIANVFKGMGKIGDKISKAFLNEDTAAVEAAIPQLLEGWKDVFGVRLSDADLKILEDKLPSASKTPEANRAVLGILRKYADMNLLRGKIANDIKKEYKDLRPLGYARMIEERFDQMIQPVRVINPNNGKEIEIPAYQLSSAIEKGARLVND